MILILALAVGVGFIVLVFLAGMRMGALLAERNIAVAELKDLRKKNGLE